MTDRTSRRGFVKVAAALLVLAGCRHDSYDAGTGDYSLVRGDFVEAYVDGYADVRSMVTDDGDSLALTAPYAASWATKPDTVYRTMTYYKKVDEGRAEVVSMGQVPVLVPVDADKAGEIPTDPLTFESVWVSRSGRYVNVAFWLKTGTDTTDGAQRQTVGMVSPGIRRNADGTSVVCLVMTHDQGDVPEYYSRKHYVSIPTSRLPQADSVQLTVNTYQGVAVKRVRL